MCRLPRVCSTVKDMEQVIRAEAAEYRIRSRIEQEYDVITQNREEEILFQIQKDRPDTVAVLKCCSAAMRRMPAISSANHLPGMADVVRADTGVLIMNDRDEKDHDKVMHAILAYQNAAKIPCILTFTRNIQQFERYGFGMISQKTEYRVNDLIIKNDALIQARIRGSIELVPSYVRLAALRKDNLMNLAYFANSILSRNYGFFMIRSAVYFEKLLLEMENRGGGVYQIMEYGKMLGYLAVDSDGRVREAVFENDFDRERYLIRQSKDKVAVMARITNMDQMLMHVASKGNVRIALSLKDEIYEQNDGLFIWYLDEKGSRLERVEQSARNPFHPELSITAAQMVSFIFGQGKLKENLKFDSIYLLEPVFVNETEV